MAEHWQLHWITSIYKCWKLYQASNPPVPFCCITALFWYWEVDISQHTYPQSKVQYNYCNFLGPCQKFSAQLRNEGHKSTLTCPETKLKEYTTRLKNWLDTDKGNKKLQRPVEGMGGIGLRNLHDLAWQEGSRSNSWGKYIKNWDTYCLCSRDKKEWIHKLVDPLSGKRTPVFKKKKKSLSAPAIHPVKVTILKCVGR